MQKIKIDSLENLEKEYLSKNTPYIIEQKFITQLSNKELLGVIKIIEFSFNKAKTRNKLLLNTLKKSKQYINGTIIDKYYLEQFIYIFNLGWEVDEKKKILTKLKSSYLLNHTDFLKSNNFKKVDINSIPIKDIINIFIKLPDNLRKNFKCPLPLHNDKTASMHIYENSNSYFCFGCHSGGNSINFISDIENITIKEAYKKFINLIK